MRLTIYVDIDTEKFLLKTEFSDELKLRLNMLRIFYNVGSGYWEISTQNRRDSYFLIREIIRNKSIKKEMGCSLEDFKDLLNISKKRSFSFRNNGTDFNGAFLWIIGDEGFYKSLVRVSDNRNLIHYDRGFDVIGVAPRSINKGIEDVFGYSRLVECVRNYLKSTEQLFELVEYEAEAGREFHLHYVFNKKLIGRLGEMALLGSESWGTDGMFFSRIEAKIENWQLIYDLFYLACSSQIMLSKKENVVVLQSWLLGSFKEATDKGHVHRYETVVLERGYRIPSISKSRAFDAFC